MSAYGRLHGYVAWQHSHSCAVSECCVCLVGDFSSQYSKVSSCVALQGIVFIFIVVMYVRYEVLTVVKKVHIVFFWVMTLYSLVGEYQCFEDIYCLHLQSRNPPIRASGVIAQKLSVRVLTIEYFCARH